MKKFRVVYYTPKGKKLSRSYDTYEEAERHAKHSKKHPYNVQAIWE